MSKYWVNTVSRDHVMLGVQGGFTQANHGKPYGLKHLQKGDWITFYSPKESLNSKVAVQAFTALGIITDEAPYQVEMTPTFHPFRRNVEFLPCHDAPIRPLIESLGFIKDKQHWGYIFRLGLFEIPEADFILIKERMTGDYKS